MLKEKIENHKFFIGIISLFAMIRIYLGMNMPIWIFPTKFYDDMLMYNYSNLEMHFNFWNIQSLSKDMGYPIFLFLVRITHLPYRFWLSIFWIIAAILVIYALYKYLSKDKRILACAYLFVLFLPVAFDFHTGLRLYRNAIITPAAIIFLLTLYIFLNKLLESKRDIKSTVIWGVLSGLSFTFSYYIKEDGIVTLPILLVCILAVLLFKIYDEKRLSFSKPDLKHIGKISIICIIPLLIFVGGTFAYQEVNNIYFGVPEINTRTSGELGDFHANLLKIEDSNKTREIWIPASTVKMAVNASPTLKEHPEFVKEWLNTNWGTGSLKDSSIPGDLTAWSLREAIEDAGLYEDEKSASDFFKKVNDELDAAFASGQLKQSGEIFITDSANGKNMSEITALMPYILSGMDMTLFYHGFEFNNVTFHKSSLLFSNEGTENVSRDLNDYLINQSELDNSSVVNLIPLKLIELDLSIYHIVSYFIALLSVAGFILICYNQIKNRFTNRKMNILLLFCIMLIGTVLVQIFAVSWFCSWMRTGPWGEGSILNNLTIHLKMYLASTYGFFTVFEVLSLAGVYNLVKKYNLKKKLGIGNLNSETFKLTNEDE